MNESYNPTLDYLETQEIKEYIEKIIQTILIENYGASKISHSFVSEFENISNSKPFRSINFDTLDGTLLQVNEKPISSIIKRYKDSDIPVSKNVYTDYIKVNRDVKTSSVFEKWIGTYVNTDYSLSNIESYSDMINKFFSILKKIEKLVFNKNSKITPAFSDSKSIAIIDWSNVSKKYSYLSANEIFKKMSLDSKLNIYSSTSEDFFIEMNYPLREKELYKNTLVLTYYNKYQEKPVVLATFSDIDYSSPNFKFITKDNYDSYEGKVATQINIDALTMILTKKRTINEVQ